MKTSKQLGHKQFVHGFSPHPSVVPFSPEINLGTLKTQTPASILMPKLMIAEGTVKE